jgi:hypothetical protein
MGCDRLRALKSQARALTLPHVPQSLFILFGLGVATLLPSLVGGVHMLPHGWVYRREEPEKFWFIFAAQAAGVALFLGVAMFALSR